MLARFLRGALAGAPQHAQQLISRPCFASLGSVAAEGWKLDTESSLLSDRVSENACVEAPDTDRTISHGHASASPRCVNGDWHRHSSTPLISTTSHATQLQQLRCFGYRPPKARFRLPDNIASLVKAKIHEHKEAAPAPPPAPALAKRPMKEDSMRVGCIATKAGMTQEWDEHGVRVPLTVLWIDECQVVDLKTKEVNGYNGIMLGAGHKRQKCISPSRAGFFLKAGVPFKQITAEWPVSEDAMLPVGTHIGGAHFVPGQRVDITGWTKYKGFQGVMKRWGFKGLPASHGVSVAHRSAGSIGNRQDPGKVWKGKKMAGCMGNERRTVQHCLVYKVDAARNLVYVRGQVPGPAGRSVLLRDSRLSSPEQRLGWNMPFPTHVPLSEQLAAAPAPGDFTAVPDPAAAGVWRNPKDPYLMYREETDYFPIEWKKGE